MDEIDDSRQSTVGSRQSQSSITVVIFFCPSRQSKSSITVVSPSLMRHIMLLLAAVLGLVTDAAASVQTAGLDSGGCGIHRGQSPTPLLSSKQGRVVHVGSGPKDVPAGAEVVNLRRYTGLPGLIDLHTHITYFWDRQPATRPLGQRRRPAVTVFLAQDNARRTLESGVTTRCATWAHRTTPTSRCAI